MATAKIDSNRNTEQKIEQLLNEVAQLKVPDLDRFKTKFERLFKEKKPPAFIKKEKELIDKIINGGPSEEFWKEYDVLAAKLEAETMTPSENQAFLKLTEITGQWAVERTKLMVTLSKLWNTSLDDVRVRLKIKPRERFYA